MEDAIIDKHFILDEFVRDGRSGSLASFHLAPVGKCFVERGAFTDRRGKRLFIFL